MKQKDLFKNGHAFNLASHFDINHGFIPMVLALITSFQSGPLSI